MESHEIAEALYGNHSAGYSTHFSHGFLEEYFQ
jgi:hypothetical protein